MHINEIDNELRELQNEGNANYLKKYFNTHNKSLKPFEEYKL